MSVKTIVAFKLKSHRIELGHKSSRNIQHASYMIKDLRQGKKYMNIE